MLGTLLVLVIYGLGARLFNRTTGLAAAFIAAIAPFQVYYSQEARMYILVALEGALAVLLFWWFVAQEDARLPVDGSPPRRRRQNMPACVCCRSPACCWCWSGWRGSTRTTRSR